MSLPQPLTRAELDILFDGIECPGQRLKKLRERLGYSEFDFAGIADCSIPTVGFWENGWCANAPGLPGTSALQSVSRLLGVSAEDAHLLQSPGIKPSPTA